MRTLLFLLLSASTCFAQFVPCKFGQVSTNDHQAVQGITIKSVSIIEDSGTYPATVIIPDGKAPAPGMLFSYANIHSRDAGVDLVRFARGMAHAGVASIVLDGDIRWDRSNPPYVSAERHSAHLLACAGQWMLNNVNMDRKRLADAGPLDTWGFVDTPVCQPGERPCWQGKAVLNFGRWESPDDLNTEILLSPNGVLHFARFAQRCLDLPEIKPEWFE